MSLNENAPRGQVLIKSDSVTWVKPPLDYSHFTEKLQKPIEYSKNGIVKTRLGKHYFASVEGLVKHLIDNPEDTFRHLMSGPFGAVDVFEVTTNSNEK